MSNKNESAFPKVGVVGSFFDGEGNDLDLSTVGGLSKREYFAISALQGLLTNTVVLDDEPNTPEYDIMMAKEAIRSADALLAELAKKD